MGPGKDGTHNPWICNQTRICCRYVTDCASQPGNREIIEIISVFENIDGLLSHWYAIFKAPNEPGLYLFYPTL